MLPPPAKEGEGGQGGGDVSQMVAQGPLLVHARDLEEAQCALAALALGQVRRRYV